MLIRDPQIHRTWLKRQITVTAFDDAFRSLLLLAGASDSDVERLLGHSAEFELDWDELMSERRADDELWLYQTTEEADEWVCGSGFAMIRAEQVAFSFAVLTLPTASQRRLPPNESGV